MKPAPFEYYAPRSLLEATELLRSIEDSKVLAGGQSLVPLMNMRLVQPAALIDLGRIPGLSTAGVGTDHIAVGAMTRHRWVELEPKVAAVNPLLPATARLVSHFQIRERGTVCGSFAHADPSAEWPMIGMLLDATLTAAGGSGERTLRARDFFISSFATALEPDEIVTSVRFPCLRTGQGWGVREVARRPGDFAIVLVGAVTEEVDGHYVSAELALGGVSTTPILARAGERLIGERPSLALVRDVAEKVAVEIDPDSDLHASADDRRDIVRALVGRVLADAHRHTTKESLR